MLQRKVFVPCDFLSPESWDVGMSPRKEANARSFGKRATSHPTSPIRCIAVSATTTVGGINGITTGSISVYPNPATDFIRIDNSGNAIGTVKLVDMSGRTVGEYDFKAENTATIDVSMLEKGVYFLITDNGKLKVIKR